MYSNRTVNNASTSVSQPTPLHAQTIYAQTQNVHLLFKDHQNSNPLNISRGLVKTNCLLEVLIHTTLISSFTIQVFIHTYKRESVLKNDTDNS